jgi:hypothetical protein
MNFTKLKPLLPWSILTILLVTAVVMRFKLAERPYLIAGTDGVYYPLQIRSLLEHHHLALPDMPLLFLLEAFVAKMILMFSGLSIDDSVMLTNRCMDAFLPALAAIPLFMTARLLRNSRTGVSFTDYLLIVFCLLNFSTVLMNSSGLQKNNFGVVLVFSLIYFCLAFAKKREKKSLFFAVATLILCALTHFGCFCVSLLFLALILLQLPFHFKVARKTVMRYLFSILGILFFLLILIALFDPNRFSRLLHIPFQIFICPAILSMIHYNNIGADINPLNLITLTPLLAIACILLVVKRKQLEPTDKLFTSALVLLCFILLMPLIGIEWYSRFLLMAYVPLTVLYLFIFNLQFSRWLKISLATGFVLVISLAFLFGFFTFREDISISRKAYEDFRKIKKELHFSDSNLVLARQDLRMLSGWEFRTKISPEYLLKKERFYLYDTIYMIRQIKETPIGRLRDALVPSSAHSLFRSEYFEILTISKDSTWIAGVGKPPLLFGEVVSIDHGSLTLKNVKTERLRSIHVAEHTTLNLVTSKDLRKGMKLEIWGTGRPFSFELDAELINEIILK